MLGVWGWSAPGCMPCPACGWMGGKCLAAHLLCQALWEDSKHVALLEVFTPTEALCLVEAQQQDVHVCVPQVRGSQVCWVAAGATGHRCWGCILGWDRYMVQ